jgi:hypothetical protein
MVVVASARLEAPQLLAADGLASSTLVRQYCGEASCGARVLAQSKASLHASGLARNHIDEQCSSSAPKLEHEIKVIEVQRLGPMPASHVAIPAEKRCLGVIGQVVEGFGNIHQRIAGKGSFKIQDTGQT